MAMNRICFLNGSFMMFTSSSPCSRKSSIFSSPPNKSVSFEPAMALCIRAARVMSTFFPAPAPSLVRLSDRARYFAASEELFPLSFHFSIRSISKTSSPLLFGALACNPPALGLPLSSSLRKISSTLSSSSCCVLFFCASAFFVGCLPFTRTPAGFLTTTPLFTGVPQEERAPGTAGFVRLALAAEAELFLDTSTVDEAACFADAVFS
mmetsp:Transcript_1165/g.3615  ORF Transcript_1165/g.3615 Transcript_1165/m.3615 type:complete len:208 (+) Transcript_1165:260-883(+)